MTDKFNSVHTFAQNLIRGVITPRNMNDDTVAPLEKYIQQVWDTPKAVKLFGTNDQKNAATTPVPMLRKHCKNRIIYYIGSFNPPHLGHLSLIDHVISNTSNASISSSTLPASPENLNAVALIVIPHGERWIQRKLSKVPTSRSPAGKRRADLHLDVKQRYKLLRDGIPDEVSRKGVWVTPGDLGEWWALHGKLKDLCQRDGFEIEYVELLGPDYVLQARPQCSGMHGVVTSNVCRKADFLADTPHGGELARLRDFGPWERSGQSAEVQMTEARQDGHMEEKRDRVWFCQHARNLEYMIWFVECREPNLGLDPDMSSTALRQIIAESEVEELRERIEGIAMSPKLLVSFVKGERRKG